jgi:hypothetical protein
MSLEKTLATVKCDAYHIISVALDACRDLTAPNRLLAAKLMVGLMNDGTPAVFSLTPGMPAVGPTTMVAFTATGSGHMSPSKYAQSFTKYPSLRTVAVVHLALPMRQISTEKQIKRLTEHSFLSVFTKVDGKVTATVQREPLSAPGGAIKLWLSDLVEQDDLKGLPHKCIRPLYNEYVFFGFPFRIPSRT